MDFNFTLQNADRLWTRYDQFAANAVAPNVATNYIKTIAVDNGNGGSNNYGSGIYAQKPQLLFNYITPGELMPIHREYVYPYYNLDRYPSPLQAINGVNLTIAPETQAATSSYQFISNNIQLQSIPRRLYIFAREENNARTKTNATSTFPTADGLTNAAACYAGAWNHSDTYGHISNVIVNYNNNAGLLSSATAQDLYRIAVNNGCQLSWNQWKFEVGSVLALDFGKDIQLGDLESPGKLMTSQLQLNVTVANTSPLQKNFTLYIVVVSEGTFTIVDNRCITQIGVISENDIFEASKSQEKAPYMHVENIYGGDFFSGLKHILKEALPVAKEILPIAKEVLPMFMGAGGVGGELSGEGYSGGKMMSREHLKKRMK